MKSKKADEILQSGACHVCDGELMDGHRVGCDDLAYYITAEEAIEQAEADRDAKAVEVFKHWLVEYYIEDGDTHLLEKYTQPFIQRLNEE